MPVVSRVLEENPDVDFEVVAQGRLAARGAVSIASSSCRSFLGRVSRSDRQARGRHHVGLVVADQTKRRPRAPTKRIDTARSGAALLVSDPEVYAPSQEERGLGMLVDLDPDRWVRAIADLARDRDRIRELAGLNRAPVASAKATAPPLLVEHIESGRRFWRFCED